MDIVIVGGGASGLLASLAIKKRNPSYKITVIDRNNKIGKKLRATGNGKCNICSLNSIKGRYSNEDAAYKLFKSITPNDLIKFLNENGIETVNHEGYIYPYSESANMLTDTLINNSKRLGVKFISEEDAIDYKDNCLITNKNKYHFDKLVIATGLGSSPKLGADASFVINLSKHGYKVIKPIPGLVAIKTKEDTKSVFGIRARVNIKVKENNKIYFDEDGELLFKKDGIGGIVVCHVSSIIIRNKLISPDIIVDFLPSIKVNNKLDAYFVNPLPLYLKKYKDIHKVIFHVSSLYDGKDSIASIGGVSLDNVNDFFKSKIENNVYILGEALNQDGLCGGYNLMWAFISALKASKDI